MGEDSLFRKDFHQFQNIRSKEIRDLFLLELWADCYKKLRGSLSIINTFGDVAIKMNNVGSNGKSADLKRLENRKPLFFVFEHDHWFAMTWMYTMNTLLLYTAFNIPLTVAFDQSDILFLTKLDELIDYMFMADVLVNFITGYEDDDNNSEFRLKLIGSSYIKTWFMPDLLACLPFDRIYEKLLIDPEDLNEVDMTDEEIAKKQQLFRLAKLPRLYRLIRIVRLLRLVKMGNSFKKLF